jgi:hypothetical protein
LKRKIKKNNQHCIYTEMLELALWSSIFYYPLFYVKFDSESRLDPSLEFESEWTKILFIISIQCEILNPGCQQAVGIQIPFLFNVHASIWIWNPSCGWLQSRVFCIFFNPLIQHDKLSEKAQKEIFFTMAMMIIQSSMLLLQQKASATHSCSSYQSLILVKQDPRL